jgi:hypothetical protein
MASSYESHDGLCLSIVSLVVPSNVSTSVDNDIPIVEGDLFTFSASAFSTCLYPCISSTILVTL